MNGAMCTNEAYEQATLENSVGVKHDEGKLEWNLLPDEQLESVVRVLMHGAKKYAEENWKKVSHPEVRYYNAARRHIQSWRKGEICDLESGEPHLAHAVCDLLFLLYFDDIKK